jgi:phage baseplate assembly protein W
MAVTGDEGRAIAFPFSIDSSGSIGNTGDENIIWEDRVRVVLLTTISERVMRPDFGSRLSDLVYENDFGQTGIAEKAAAAAFNKWFPSLTLDGVTAVADVVNGGLLVQVDYTLPSGQKQSTSAKVTVATLNRYGDIEVGG